MSDLRAKIADAARRVPIHLGPNSIANAQAGHALRLSGSEADQVADAVMGLIEAEHGGPKCVSADIYDQVCGQMHDAHEEAQAAKGRVRELEKENQKLRTAACTRCEGTAVDPEDSCPGSYGGHDTEPPTLEPCRDCVIPAGITREITKEGQ